MNKHCDVMNEFRLHCVITSVFLTWKLATALSDTCCSREIQNKAGNKPKLWHYLPVRAHGQCQSWRSMSKLAPVGSKEPPTFQPPFEVVRGFPPHPPSPLLSRYTMLNLEGKNFKGEGVEQLWEDGREQRDTEGESWRMKGKKRSVKKWREQDG